MSATQTREIRILLVDDHEILRKGLILMVQDQPGTLVVGEAADGRTALELAGTLGPDVVIMDVHLPDTNGIEVSRQILARHPRIKIIALSADPNLAVVSQALQAGILAYLTKVNGPEQLHEAIRTVLDHRVFLGPEVASLVLEDYMRNAGVEPSSPRPRLSARERQVLKLVAEGKRNKETAETLGIGVKSVETYRSRLMRKLGCNSTAELTRYAVREGITSL